MIDAHPQPENLKSITRWHLYPASATGALPWLTVSTTGTHEGWGCAT